MPRPMKIDVVSDVACPWCAVGFMALQQALARTADVIDPKVSFQPFELNPEMPPGGQDSLEYVARNYGITPEQAAANREAIRARAAELGFDMAALDRRRLYNTFDAHRLLHWAELEGRQTELKRVLFEAHFTDGRDIWDPDVLADLAVKAGLDGQAARDVLTSGRYAEEVRAAEQLWRARGVHSVPAVIINDRYLVSGGQPPEVFEEVLRKVAAEAADASSSERRSGP